MPSSFSPELPCVLNIFIIGKTPAYYYGTHYSSAMIVASYLIRLEPFTQHFLRLQVIEALYFILFFSLSEI